ncbi:MAG: hypothetical protein RIR52_483, partial [Acidobacteriota bacterium]
MILKKRARRWWRLVAILTVCLGVLPEVAILMIAGVISRRPLSRDTLVAIVGRRLARV